MNGARRTDGLLSAAKTLAFVEHLKRANGSIHKKQIIKDFTNSNQASFARTHNTILMLKEASIISINHENEILLHVRVSNQSMTTALAQFVSSTVCARILESGNRNVLTWSVSDQKLLLDSFLFPSSINGLGLWIKEFGVAKKINGQTRLWEVDASHEIKFLDCVRNQNENLKLKSFTLSQLKSLQDRQSEMGLQAENWVVNYEKLRLKNHPLREQIRSVSDSHTSAGFDIVSFENLSSLSHDRFIEVKSFGELMHFYWSENEIQNAKALGEKYCLYLVDRNKMNQTGYQPTIITGPYIALMETPDSGWERKVASYEFVKRSTE